MTANKDEAVKLLVDPTEVSVQNQDFSVDAEIQNLRNQSAETGAIATFQGLVSDLNDGSKVTSLTLEHYPGMTEKSLQKIVNEAKERWPLLGARVIHRVGTLQVKDQIVFVGTSSRHRQAAFDACQFIMDYLKTDAPFWKKEVSDSGESWVDSRDSDHSARQKWEEQ